MSYRYKKYPGYRYHKKGEKEPILIQNAEEDIALSSEWEKYPIKQVTEILEKHDIDTSGAEDLAKNIANATNILSQVPGIRSRKKLLTIAFDLGVTLDQDKTLKEMKLELIKKAELGGTL